MVRCKARGHLFDGDQAGGGQHTGLAHSSAEPLAKMASASDRIGGSGQHRTDRRGESF